MAARRLRCFAYSGWEILHLSWHQYDMDFEIRDLDEFVHGMDWFGSMPASSVFIFTFLFL